MGSAGFKLSSCPHGYGTVPIVLGGRHGAPKPTGDHAEMLHFKHQYKLPARGIKIQLPGTAGFRQGSDMEGPENTASCLELRKRTQARIIYVFRSQTLLCHTSKGRLAAHRNPLGTACSSVQGPFLRCWEGALPRHMGDPHFRGHRWQWDRRTRAPEHIPWLRAGCYAAPLSNAAGASCSPWP